MKPLVRLAAVALSTILVVIALGCDKKEKPTQALPPAEPTLQTLWPNEDGRFWSYRIVARQWADTGARYYQSRDSVPPVPTLAQLAALLGVQPIGANPVADTATFQLKFEGQMTTASGVTAQRLTETVSPAPLAASSSGWNGSAYRAALGSGGFLRDLARARPDLAPRLVSFVGRVPATGTGAILAAHAPLFLFGYAWRRTSEWIGSYGDVDTALAWKYLTKSLAPSSEFTHQLVPSLASDVFLHGRILNRQTVQTPAGTFTNAVVCLYAVDYGIAEGVDPAGNPAGYYRFYSYGSIAYAANVGPVASYERLLVGLGNPSLGFSDQSFVLTSSGVAKLAARR